MNEFLNAEHQIQLDQDKTYIFTKTRKFSYV